MPRNKHHNFLTKRSDILKRQVPLCFFTVIFLCILNPSPAIALKIRGRVIDKSTGAPVSNAFVEIHDGLVPLEQFPLPISFDGRFELTLPKTELTHITLKFTAKNYLRVTKNVTINSDQNVVIGDISLSGLPSLKLSTIVLNQSSDTKKNIFDIALFNVSKENAFINKIVITGKRKSSTDCLDYSQIVTIEIHDRIQASEAVIQTDTQPGSDKITIGGNIEVLPCAQMRLKYIINYVLIVKTEETFKLRLILPSEVDYLKTKRKVDLLNWDEKNIQFFLDNGEIIQATK